MTTNKRISNLLLTAVCSLVAVAIATPADAGRGGSFSAIRNAVSHGGEDAIIAELERAENIPCTVECMNMVKGLLDDNRYRVREAGAWWFARRAAQKNALLVESIATLTSTTDSTAARNAADVLGTFRLPAAVPVLTAVVNRTDLSSEARAHIVQALGTIGADIANPAIEVALTDGSAQVRLAAVNAWSAIRFQRGAAPVAALVSDSDISVRRAATRTVGTFAQADARAQLESIVLNDADAAVRRNAAWALGKIGDAGSRDVLTQAVQDDSSLVRMTAKVAIRSLR